MNVFLSAAKHIVSPRLRKELLRQQPACEALNRTALNLTTLRPCIPKENILLIEAIHDLFVDKKSMEALWHAWGQPEIWRLPHSHASKSLVSGLTGRVLRWLAHAWARPPFENLSLSLNPISGRRVSVVKTYDIAVVLCQPATIKMGPGVSAPAG